MRAALRAMWEDTTLLLLVVPIVLLIGLGVARLDRSSDLDDAAAESASPAQGDTVKEEAPAEATDGAGGDAQGATDDPAALPSAPLTDSFDVTPVDDGAFPGDAAVAPADPGLAPAGVALPPIAQSGGVGLGADAPGGAAPPSSIPPGAGGGVASPSSTVPPARPTTTALPATTTTTQPGTTTTTVPPNPPAPVDESPVVALLPMTAALAGGAGFVWVRRRARRGRR